MDFQSRVQEVSLLLLLEEDWKRYFLTNLIYSPDKSIQSRKKKKSPTHDSHQLHLVGKQRNSIGILNTFNQHYMDFQSLFISDVFSLSWMDKKLN